MNLLLRVLFIVQDFDRVRFEVDVKRIFSHSHPLLAICRLLCSLCVCMCVCLRALSLSSARAYVCVYGIFTSASRIRCFARGAVFMISSRLA